MIGHKYTPTVGHTGSYAFGDHVRRNLGATVVELGIPPALAVGSVNFMSMPRIIPLTRAKATTRFIQGRKSLRSMRATATIISISLAMQRNKLSMLVSATTPLKATTRTALSLKSARTTATTLSTATTRTIPLPLTAAATTDAQLLIMMSS